MLRWLLGVVGWVVSTVLRIAFVVCVVALAAGFALGGLPTQVSDLGGAVGNATDLGPLEDVSDLAEVGAVGVSDTESGSATNSTTNTSIPSSNSEQLNGTRIEYLVHQGINERRAAHGESNLSFDTGLRSIARYHSADMANRSYFAHTGPNGETVTDRYEKFDYQCRVSMDGLRYATGGENILYTYYDAPVKMENRTVEYDTQKELARGIVNGWMNSTEHRENLLKPYWENEGIGIYIEEVDGRTRVYASQEFC